jgi:hypothetical protein
MGLPDHSNSVWTLYSTDLIEISRRKFKGATSMPTISMFYGLIIRMYFFDTDRHGKPHIHVEYQGVKAVIEIPGGGLIAGTLPTKQSKLVSAWVEIHEEELLADWQLAINGEPVFKIEPLR